MDMFILSPSLALALRSIFQLVYESLVRIVLSHVHIVSSDLYPQKKQ